MVNENLRKNGENSAHGPHKGASEPFVEGLAYNFELVRVKEEIHAEHDISSRKASKHTYKLLLLRFQVFSHEFVKNIGKQSAVKTQQMIPGDLHIRLSPLIGEPGTSTVLAILL